jgi:hypothetical protein
MDRIADLAQALGVRYDPKVGADDITIAGIRAAYERHGLFAHAARLIDLEIKETTAQEARFRLMLSRATLLHRAGQADAARMAAQQLESELLGYAKQSPALPGPQKLLADLYLSRAAGPNYPKALDAITAARKIDPAYDASRTQTIHCLYELGKFRDAWEAWRAALRDRGTVPLQEPTVFLCRDVRLPQRDEQRGALLTRQALFRYPDSPLAAKAREMLK